MLSPGSPDIVSHRPWVWRLVAAFLILLAAFLRLAYLTSDASLDLSPDEAHYWDWSRHLDLSYYSKGPLVAYLIRAGCWLAGPLSRELTGTEMLAVRLPAVICGSLLLASLYVLTALVFKRERLALAVVAFALTLPLFAAGSTLMTIDAPYTCCWGWALVFGYLAVLRQATWAWPAAGLCVGLGILAKYTMILWIPSLVLFLLTMPAYRPTLRQSGFWIMGLLVALCSLPILIWNVQHDWVSLWHLGGHAGLSGRSGGIHWLGPLRYLGLQFAILLGFWFVAWLGAMTRFRPGKEPSSGVRYLWWMSAPMFVFFLLFSLKNGGGEPNWPVAAYLSGLVLGVAWLAEQLSSPRLCYRRLSAVTLALACGVGLALSLLMHHSAVAYPLLAAWSGPPTLARPLPIRRLDPTCRLRGWRTLAAAVDRIRDDLRWEGIEPLLVGCGWTLPGEIAFYCDGQPTVYSVGLALGDRHSQYDLWRPNPVADGQAFLGRTFILIGGGEHALQNCFDRIEETHEVIHCEGGEPVARWTISVCRGFRGFGPSASTAGRY
jgi:4-amino-4-deoxy-L-arabinose transferase-like glycosyltransferase